MQVPANPFVHCVGRRNLSKRVTVLVLERLRQIGTLPLLRREDIKFGAAHILIRIFRVVRFGLPVTGRGVHRGRRESGITLRGHPQ